MSKPLGPKFQPKSTQPNPYQRKPIHNGKSAGRSDETYFKWLQSGNYKSEWTFKNQTDD